MRKLILIFSHTLTEKQIIDAKENLNTEDFIYLPLDLQQLWSSIPSDIYDISYITDKIKRWINNTVNKNDYILVQGDFGATYDIVNFCKSMGFKTVYSTTQRRVKETLNKNGTVKIARTFEHVMFREY